MTRVQTTQDAVRALRAALGESQQAFANRMKAAIRTIARYEADQPPKGRVLADLRDLARQNGLPQIAAAFDRAIATEITDTFGSIGTEILQASSSVVAAQKLVRKMRDDKQLPDTMRQNLQQISEHLSDAFAVLSRAKKPSREK